MTALYANPRELSTERNLNPLRQEPAAAQEVTIRRTLGVLIEPGTVVELRALNKGWTRSGYFDDHDALAEEAVELDRQGWQVYVTMNPVKEALLARAANRVVERPKATTSDNDVTRRRWLLVDFDPTRPSEISATMGEKKAAYERAKEVRAYLKVEGWPEPVIADSGNGFHFLYRVDLPNDRESRELVKGVLEALAFKFDDDRAKIDTSVHNAARIVRLYGTTTRKGDHTQERPHRRSKIEKVNNEEAV